MQRGLFFPLIAKSVILSAQWTPVDTFAPLVFHQEQIFKREKLEMVASVSKQKLSFEGKQCFQGWNEILEEKMSWSLRNHGW